MSTWTLTGRWAYCHYVLKPLARAVYRLHPDWGWAVLRYARAVRSPWDAYRFREELRLPDGTYL